MPNTFAYLMLLIWPVVCLVLFRRLSLERAIIWSILGGYLLLPPRASFDLPLVPALDKFSIASLSAFFICVAVMKKPVRLWPDSTAGRALIALFVLGVVPTVLTNGDPILFRYGPNADPLHPGTDGIPGMTIRDLLSVVAQRGIVLLPFLLARQYLSTERGLREILVALVLAGLAYSVPALIEIRLSPQLNTWIYGFFQHEFSQMIRDGGFRPIVFLPHALWLAFFLVATILSAAAMTRSTPEPDRSRYMLAMIYLAGVLFLSKSLAAQLYTAAFAPLVLFASPRMQVRVALVLALIAVIYPILRNGGLIPTERILQQALDFDPSRAQSLAYRWTNEDLLLARADERPWFGWGSWGRNLVYDPETGQRLTVPDGRWIIVFGAWGWTGYVAEMGLLALPIVLIARRARSARGGGISRHAVAVAVILAANMVDMLLNATLVPFTWLCAGAVLGHAERLRNPVGHDIPDRPPGEGPVIGGPPPGKGRRTVL